MQRDLWWFSDFRLLASPETSQVRCCQPNQQPTIHHRFSLQSGKHKTLQVFVEESKASRWKATPEPVTLGRPPGQTPASLIMPVSWRVKWDRKDPCQGTRKLSYWRLPKRNWTRRKPHRTCSRVSWRAPFLPFILLVSLFVDSTMMTVWNCKSHVPLCWNDR